MWVEFLYSQTGKNWSSDVNCLDPDEPNDLNDHVPDDSLSSDSDETSDTDLKVRI